MVQPAALFVVTVSNFRVRAVMTAILLLEMVALQFAQFSQVFIALSPAREALAKVAWLTATHAPRGQTANHVRRDTFSLHQHLNVYYVVLLTVISYVGIAFMKQAKVVTMEIFKAMMVVPVTALLNKIMNVQMTHLLNQFAIYYPWISKNLSYKSNNLITQHNFAFLSLQAMITDSILSIGKQLSHNQHLLA